MSNTTPAIYHNGHFYGNEVGNTILMDNKLNKLSDNIAPKQDTDTASKLIDVGEYFINKDGYLCQCDIQIANQGTITVGTNCHLIPNGLANELNSKIPSGGGEIIEITVSGIQTASNWNVLGQYRAQGYHILNIVSEGNMYGTPSFYYSRIMQGADEWDIRLTFTWAYGGKDMITADLIHDSNMNYTFYMYDKGSSTDWNTVFGSGTWTYAKVFLYK